MSDGGRKFKIKLNPSSFGSEHEHPLLKPHDGKTCRLVAEILPRIYVTDIPADPAGTPNSDYVFDGFLVVMTDKDGVFVGRR